MYDVPAKYRATYERALAGRSPKAAIKAHCLMCCGWQIREVQLCTAPKCPLFTMRKRYFKGKSGPQTEKTASGTPGNEIRAQSVVYRGLTVCGHVVEGGE